MTREKVKEIISLNSAYDLIFTLEDPDQIAQGILILYTDIINSLAPKSIVQRKTKASSESVACKDLRREITDQQKVVVATNSVEEIR